MIKEALIIAGGLGTRLRGVVDDLPKPMAPVRGQPFLTWLFDLIEKQGVEKVVLATGYKHEKISSFFDFRYKNLNIEYSVEAEPLGTGGAVLMALQKIKGENFFLLNGDTYFEVNFHDFEDFFNSTGSVMSVALHPVKNAARYGTVILQGNRIVAFGEKTANKGGLINGGIYVVNKKWFEENAPGEKFSLEKDVLEKKISDNLITGYVSDAYFIDIGIPEDYYRAGEELPPAV